MKNGCHKLMKILFVIHGLRSGGAEKVLIMLANYLVTIGYQVSILIFTTEEPFYDIHSSVKLIKIEHIPDKKGLFPKLKFIFTRVNLLRKIFKNENPDIVISFITMMNIYSIVAAKLARKKIIVSEHTNYTVDSKSISGFIRRLVYPFADFVVVLTNYDKEQYAFVKNVHVIKNPLVLSNNYTNCVRENIVLGVGTLIPLKGFDMLIKAFSKLEENAWKLVILGEGPDREELQNLIDELDLRDKVSLPGMTKDVEKYYRKASIFVLSSRTEGFPGVLCEAIGYGCASIAFDCLTGPSDIIEHNINGILVDPENVNKLSQEIQKLIDDPELRSSLSLHSQKITSLLDIKTISNEWIKLFDSIKES